MAGTLKHIVSNSCQKLAGMGASGETSIEVGWVVYDLVKKVEIVTLTTGGAAKAEAQTLGGQKALFDALGVAIRHFLAQMEHRWPQ